MDTKKFLDYDGLKKVISSEHAYIEGITGKNFTVAGNKVDMKRYIDSRIFVGDAAAVEAALAAKQIDDTTFTMVVDPDVEEITSIDTADIDALFN